MTIPTTETLDAELHRRDPSPLAFLPDDELAELAELLEGLGGGEGASMPLDVVFAGRSREARQAARLWRRGEARKQHNVWPSEKAPAWMHYPLERLPGTDACVADDPDCRCIHWVLDRGGRPLDFWPEHLHRQRVRDERRKRREEPSPVTTEPTEPPAPTGQSEPRQHTPSVSRRRRGARVDRFPTVDPRQRLAELGLTIIDGERS